MLLRRTTILVVTTLLASGATLLAAPTANADGIGSFDELQAAINGCDTVTLTQDIAEPARQLTVNCSATLDLNGHDLAVRNVEIDGSAGQAFTVADNTPAQAGTLTADSRRAFPYSPDQETDDFATAGIEVNLADLVIDGGTVHAFGGEQLYQYDLSELPYAEFGQPGIGPGWEAAGKMIVNGGAVNATGGRLAAGIGGRGGYYNNATGMDLTVTGGTVRATGGAPNPYGAYGGPGIGSGSGGAGPLRSSNSGTTTVNGGTVIATGGSGIPASQGNDGHSIGGTGIGGGSWRPSGTLIVNAGTVIAKGGASYSAYTGSHYNGGSGIGAGASGNRYTDDSGAQGGTVIKAGATVITSGGDSIGVFDASGESYPNTGSAFGVNSENYGMGSPTGQLKVSGTLRLLGGNVLLSSYDSSGNLVADQYSVTSTGKILGTVDDPTVGSTISGYDQIHNDGVIALSTDRVRVGVTGQSHAVTFDTHGGSAVAPVTVFATNFAAGYRTFPSEPTRAGFTFLGWNTAADGTGDTVTSHSDLPAGNLTAHAQWLGSPFTVDKPTINGSAVFDHTLTATQGGTDLTGTTSTYVWKSGATVLGTGSTYQVKAGDIGNTITVTQTTSKDGLADQSATSDPTTAVAQGSFSSTVAVTVAGTAKVGRNLAGNSTGSVVPAATTTTGQWFRGAEPITGATAFGYTLVNADAGSTITYRQTRQRAGYADLVSSSAPTAMVTGGTITLGAPTIAGTPTVDQTLTAASGVSAPTGTASTYVWKSGATQIGTGSTYKIKPTDVGNTITLVETATKAGHNDTTAASAATAAVTKATFAATGSVQITGTPRVGQELTGTSTVDTSPGSTSTSRQWFRGADRIPGATGTTYTLTGDDVATPITYTETRTRDGYTDLVMPSAPTAVVAPGVITVVAPTIIGTAVVDSTLTVTPGAVAPSDASISYSWRTGDTELGTGSTYTVKPADVSHTISVIQTAAKSDHDLASAESEPTAKVAKAEFGTAPSASFTGVLKVGEELTAAEGTPAPAPDSYAYQWFADGDEIARATSRTLTLTSAQKGAVITVRVTAIRAGYVDSPNMSAPSAATVASDQAPSLSLGASSLSVRLGQATTLNWASSDAITVTGSGAWSGFKTPTGHQSVTPVAVGTSTYVMSATNENGTTTAQIAVTVSLPAATFTVKAPPQSTAGKKITVSASGLAPAESYTIAIAGIKVTTGHADRKGNVSVSIGVPTAVAKGKQLVSMTGSLPDRRGQTSTMLIRVSSPKLKLSKSSLRIKAKQSVTITRLEPGEKVTVTYRGKRISPKTAKANRLGVYKLVFRVGSKTGRMTVKVTSGFHPKRISSSFRVKR